MTGWRRNVKRSAKSWRRNAKRKPESRTNDGNGPKVDLHFHRRNTRLENSWSNLEAMRASRTGTNCRASRTGTNCRAESCEAQEGPLLHGVGHLDVDSCCSEDMEIGSRRGGPPHFPSSCSGNIKGPTTADPRGAPGSRSRISGAQQPERTVRPYWGISTQKHLKTGWGGGSGNSMLWVIAEVWCFAPTAGLW